MTNEYKPDSVSPPGETLREILKRNRMTQSHLAHLINRPKKTINEIVQGKAIITPRMAIQLEKALGVPAEFWLMREVYYRLWKARQDDPLAWMDGSDWAQSNPFDKEADNANPKP